MKIDELRADKAALEEQIEKLITEFDEHYQDEGISVSGISIDSQRATNIRTGKREIVVMVDATLKI